MKQKLYQTTLYKNPTLTSTDGSSALHIDFTLIAYEQVHLVLI